MGKPSDGRFQRKEDPVPCSRSQIAEEVAACIGCGECLTACPALDHPLTIEMLNRETVGGPRSLQVAHFTASCVLCGACVPVCPVGLHRDAMMLWLKMQLLRPDEARTCVPYRQI
jgi:formate hydrogenlyase subunit 6/NADH:ubiquinone oxidoreductase subunit I